MSHEAGFVQTKTSPNFFSSSTRFCKEKKVFRSPTNEYRKNIQLRQNQSVTEQNCCFSLTSQTCYHRWRMVHAAEPFSHTRQKIPAFLALHHPSGTRKEVIPLNNQYDIKQTDGNFLSFSMSSTRTTPFLSRPSRRCLAEWKIPFYCIVMPPSSTGTTCKFGSTISCPSQFYGDKRALLTRDFYVQLPCARVSISVRTRENINLSHFVL